MAYFSAERYHDISCGHRVVGHEGKCQNLHGHNYRITFSVERTYSEGLDSVGRVIDFTVIKTKLCTWLEENWDHKFLIWDKDPILPLMRDVYSYGLKLISFNPTAENMAWYLTEVVGPEMLMGTGARLTEVQVEETRKCSAIYGVLP